MELQKTKRILQAVTTQPPTFSLNSLAEINDDSPGMYDKGGQINWILQSYSQGSVILDFSDYTF